MTTASTSIRSRRLWLERHTIKTRSVLLVRAKSLSSASYGCVAASDAEGVGTAKAEGRLPHEHPSLAQHRSVPKGAPIVQSSCAHRLQAGVSSARERSSWRVRGSSRTTPRSAEVTVRAPGLATPRSDMQLCSASRTTPTPRGGNSRSSQSATCTVCRSCTCRSRAEVVDDLRELRQADDSLPRQMSTWAIP